MSKNIFILGAKRTPFGKFGGTLKDMSANELAVESAKATLASANVPASEVDSSVYGNVLQTCVDAPYLARHVALKTGCRVEIPALNINRLCGSGFQSIINAAHEIMLGESQIVLTGGTESMSQAPYAVRNTRFGMPMGKPYVLEDTLTATLVDSHVGIGMGVTAENLASKYNISREECDAYAIRSQELFTKAQKEGKIDAEIAPVTVKRRRKEVEFKADDYPKPDTNLAEISKLRPVFKIDGVVTAAQASGIVDGAGSILIGGDDAAAKYKPLARVVSWHVNGCDPSIMGIGPVEAIKGALKKANLTLDDMDLIEVNEAFAAQFLAVAKELNLDMSKTNVNGGAISVGHPLAASGSRIMGHLTHQLIADPSKRYAIGSACIGGGQGIAIVIERV